MTEESAGAATLAAPPADVALDSRSPYPGLRPFLEFESAYFYGRSVQVGEIIERLRKTRFVAVLGGSGSGKSSLVLAGVIPDLRSFAVAEAGDFWIPIVSTPGTNHAPGDSPVTRVARRFCAALKPLDEPAASQRVEDCARLLRSPDGFAEMIERHGGALADTADLDPGKANFLLLIDQFEELFHHSNRALADCDRLVERVIDNFKSPHPRVFVIITMRSEHLSDCARYLELPDAINRASYLVPRLNAQQIGESIEKPALRYLRLLARRASQRLRRERRAASDATDPGVSVPEASELDAAVRDRLIADAEALRDKPDHLPLLQHLLFRLWEAARTRAARNGAVAPERIDAMDLRRAVWADVERAEVAELPKGNCLQVCLEQWAQRLYAARPADAAALDQVLRRLAFKEPNTGTYTQQRAGFDELVRLLGLPNEAALRALLEPWLTPHAYLFWDTESRTVKVAHESFIRGWSHFSRCVNEEDERFQEFVRLLDECQRWQSVEGAEQRRKQLIGGSRLRRVLDVGLDRALEGQAKSHLASLLKLHRDGERLAPAVPVVEDFLERSINEEKRREESEARRVTAERELKARRRRYISAAVGVALIMVLVPAISWWVELGYGKKERLLHRAYAFDVETVLATDYQFSSLESAQIPLRSVMVGTWHLAAGNNTSVGWLTNLFTKVVQRNRVAGAERTSILAEMRAVAALRTVLGLPVWPVSRTDAGAARESPPPAQCAFSVEGPPGAKPSPQRSAWFFARSTTPGIGLAVTGGGFDSLQVFVARLPESGRCELRSPIVSIPPFKGARVAFDADLRHMFVGVSETGATTDGQQSVQRYEIAWAGADTDPKFQERGRITSAGFAGAIWTDDQTYTRLPSIVEERRNATDVKLANGWVRVFNLEPIALPEPAGSSWARLAQASAPDCVSLRAHIDAQARMAASDASRKGVSSERIPALSMLQGKLPGGEWVCVLVTRREGPGGMNSSLSVYRAVPDQPDVNKRVPIFPEIDFGVGELTDFRLGTGGEYDGWLVAARADKQWIGTPWSLKAWQRFSEEVCNFGPVSSLDPRRYSAVFDLIRGTAAPLSADDPPTEQALCPQRAASRQ